MSAITRFTLVEAEYGRWERIETESGLYCYHSDHLADKEAALLAQAEEHKKEESILIANANYWNQMFAATADARDEFKAKLSALKSGEEKKLRDFYEAGFLKGREPLKGMSLPAMINGFIAFLASRQGEIDDMRPEP